MFKIVKNLCPLVSYAVPYIMLMDALPDIRPDTGLHFQMSGKAGYRYRIALPVYPVRSDTGYPANV
jgi:hypothetical protein